MERLTKKNENGYDTNATFNSCFNSCVKIINKLGQLEDIEEKFGIDLITLFKALMNGIYVIEDNDNYVVEDSINSIEHWEIGWGFTTNMEDLELLFSDYGKTWALTAEEIEEEALIIEEVEDK